MKNFIFLFIIIFATNLLAINLIPNQLNKECKTIQMLQAFREGIKIPRPPNGPKYIYTPHFVIHFDTVGSRAVSRALAESVAIWAEYSWAKQVDTLGWDAPPPDNNHGIDNRYDIYLMGVDPLGYSGATYADEPGPDPNQEDYTSWIELTINRSPQVTRPLVAHEFNHACQFSCSAFERIFWYENTAEWMEKITMGIDHGRVGGSGDDPDPLENPQVEITSILNGYEYAGGLWPRFLGEYWSILLPREIWSLCGVHLGEYTLYDIDSTLRRYYDSDLKKALGHYAIWRYFTGSRADAYHFSEASSYATSAILRTHSTYPASGNQGIHNPSGPGGCNFIQFGNLGDNRVTLYFDGQNGYEWSAYVIGKRSGISYEYKIHLEPNQDTGRITIPGWEYDTIVLIPVVTHWTSSAESLTYSYNVTLGSELLRIANPTGIYFNLNLNIYPNPFKNQTTIKYSIPKGKIGRLKIYDATGQIVREFIIWENNSQILWDKRDNFGQRVKNGIYFVNLIIDDKKISKKIIIE